MDQARRRPFWLDTNWDNGAPVASSIACLTLDGTYAVTQSRTDRVITGLVVSGASGTQTLTPFTRFQILGDGVSRPNGVVEVLNGLPGGGDGLYVAGTPTVEGLLLYSGSDRMSDGGLLDIAPGGTLRIAAPVRAGETVATFRVCGLLESVVVGTSTVTATLDVQGGTLCAVTGRVDFRSGGTLHLATVDSAAGALLLLVGSSTRSCTLTGALGGAPTGEVFAQDGRSSPPRATPHSP